MFAVGAVQYEWHIIFQIYDLLLRVSDPRLLDLGGLEETSGTEQDDPRGDVAASGVGPLPAATCAVVSDKSP